MLKLKLVVEFSQLLQVFLRKKRTEKSCQKIQEMWDDSVYKRALKLIQFSFLGLVIFWLGTGFHSFLVAAIGAIFGLSLFLTGAISIGRMIWMEDKDEDLRGKTR